MKAFFSRLGQMLFVLFGISVLVFVVFFATPGSDPSARIAGRGASPEIVQRVRHDYGFDRSLPVRYLTMMDHLFVSRDLTSYVNHGQNVVTEVFDAAPVTLSLVLWAAVFWIGGALFFGMVGAVWQGGRLDRLVSVLALIGLSIPVFWLGEMVNLVSQSRFHDSFLFRWVPPLGYVPLGTSVTGWARSLILPALTLSVAFIGLYSRVLRTDLLTAMQDESLRTARAKGVGPWRLWFCHALRLSGLSALSLFGLDFAQLLGGGALLTEVVFALPGVGHLTYQGLSTLDLPLIMATVLYAAFFVVMANALIDGLYRLLDPRIGGGSHGE
ncbi:ABC transporter permease [Asaia lannensis]|uniref:ABC transporter permease n=1 Tax=Asaia lannensis NBRC 102526 TaxID=1307926 RepID=A0ABT1CI56_9PROT|nr:ABC transporter permease [Asaia lannensis]MCO6159883.1 ABC transporter permease [Asaia lannensis NBRC 102526]GBQ95943.1 oligopeptide transporter permease OppB [Asaia lannensis NBRC 102526]